MADAEGQEPEQKEVKKAAHKAVIIAPDGEDRASLQAFLTENGFEVFCRDSRLRSFQLLTITQIDVVILAGNVKDAKIVELCTDIRNDAGFQNLPVLVVDGDDDNGSMCVKTLEAGADDFIDVPFVPAVMLARIKRFFKKRTKAGPVSSLSVHVSGGELPGVLAFLEAESKTGKLNVKSSGKTAVIFIHEGRLANGQAPQCKGLDAIVEVLCWPTCHVTFEDTELAEEEIKFSMETTGTIMNCVFEVDEFREAQAALPDNNAMLVPGKKIPADIDETEKRIYQLAISGYAVDSLTHDAELSERRVTMALHRLFKNGHLRASNPPFFEYVKQCYSQYEKSGSFFETRLAETSRILSNLNFPLPELPPKLALSAVDWVTPAPKVLITGDNPEHVAIMVRALADISTVLNDRKPPTKTIHKGVTLTRLYFDERAILDIMTLPPIYSPNVLNALSDYVQDACGVIVLGSSQTQKATRGNVRIVRQLRQHFNGVFYFVVPQVANRQNKYEFPMDCDNCGYSLSVDMAQQGSMGECPICNETLTIPDSLDHLAHKLSLPDDVPIVQIQPVSHKHCRDLMVFMIGSIIGACNPPEATMEEIEAERSQVLEVSEVRERAAPSKREFIAAEPEHQRARTADQTSNTGDLDQLDAILTTGSQDGIPAAENVDDPLDEILNAGEEDFDIDDFIAKVQGVKKD